MGIDEISRVLGRIEAGQETMLKKIEEHSMAIHEFLENGCPRGRSNSHRLDKIESGQPEGQQNGKNRFGSIEYWKGHVKASGLPALLLCVLAYLFLTQPSKTREAVKAAVNEVAMSAAQMAVTQAEARWRENRK